MKKFLVSLMAVMMALTVLFSFTACGSKTEKQLTDYEQIKEKGELVIGVTEYEPMNYRDENGEWTGFDTEFALAVCQELGLEAKFQIIDWDNKFIELDAKSIDCVWNGMTITDEALQNASVSNSYVKNAQVVIMKSALAAQYASIAEMGALSFAAESGSAGEAAIQENNIANYTAVSAQSDALMEVASGSVDACVIDLTMANAMTGPGTSYSDLVQAAMLNEEDYGIAFRKDSDLTEKVNAIISNMKANGALQKIADTYSLTLA